ncbi:MAG: hypothetical protein ACP5SI_07255 [Chloroflexia bacterium]
MEAFPFEFLHAEHRRILQEAEKQGVVLRLLGALAFELRCPRHVHLRSALGRQLSDLDYVALSKQWEQVVDLLSSLGYAFDERRALLHGHDRVIFFHPEGLRVDVFFDRLDMCHVVDLRDRLTIHPETISLADLLLEKLQIVRITEKDIVDIVVLFLEYPVTSGEEGISGVYVGQRLSGNWGFYYTATENLKKIRDTFLGAFPSLGDAERATVRGRIDEMLGYIERCPKTLGWKLRARIGPAVRWYKEVGELTR